MLHIAIKLLDVWTWGSWAVKVCRGCGCDPDHPCTIVLDSGKGEGYCVPAGAFASRRCSACQAKPH